MAVEIDPLTGKPKKQTVNFPYPQPGQNLPMVPAAIQQNVQQQAPQPAAAPVAQQQPQPQQTVAQSAGSVFNPNLSQQVIQTAQQKALQGASQGTAQLVSQQTQGLVKDPSMGVNYDAQRKLAMDQLARKQASDFEAMRQATGGTANLGVNIQDLMAAQMSQRSEKTDLQRQMEIDEQNRRQSDMIKALAAGKETVGMEQSLATSDIDNLLKTGSGALDFAELAAKGEFLLSEQDFAKTQDALNKQFELAMQSNDINAQKDILSKKLEFEAKQAALGYEFTASQNELNRLLQTNLANLDATTQKELVNLKALVDKDMLITEQDFKATESELMRQFQDAMQNKDFAQANKMQLMMNDFELLKQGKQNEFVATQNLVNNAFAEGMLLKEQDFTKAMEYIKLENEKALMDKDLTKQKVLMDKQAELDLHKMTQSFKHDEKMAVLESELADAMANGDVERQQQIMSFGHGLEMQKIEKEQGFVKSMAYLDNELQKSLQNNDFANAKVLNQLQYDHQMKMHMDNMKIEQAKVELQKSGIDLQRIESEYQKIQDQVKAGVLDPSMGVEYLAEAFKNSLPEGFEFKEADPLAVQKAIQEDYKNQQLQYALSFGMNPDGTAKVGIYDKNGAFTGLQDEFMKGFSDHLTDTIYSQDGTPNESDALAYKTGEKAWSSLKPSDPAYGMLLNDPSILKVGADFSNASFQAVEQGSGASRRAYFPQLETSKFINVDGTLYAVESWNIKNRAGHDDTNYILKNVDDGSMITVNAMGAQF